MSDDVMDPWEAELEYYRKWGEQLVAGTTLIVCERCGSLVAWDHQETHDKWHGESE